MEDGYEAVVMFLSDSSMEMYRNLHKKIHKIKHLPIRINGEVVGEIVSFKRKRGGYELNCRVKKDHVDTFRYKMDNIKPTVHKPSSIAIPKHKDVLR